MDTPKEERDRILHMVESGQITADEAAQLLDTLELETPYYEHPGDRSRDRVLRVRATSLNAKAQKKHLTAAIPVSLLRTSTRLGMRLIPQLNTGAVEDLLRSIESSTTGRLLDLQDMEKGERLEIFLD